jgi:hypothetical protein
MYRSEKIRFASESHNLPAYAVSLKSTLNSNSLHIPTLPGWIQPSRLSTKLLHFIRCAVIILRPSRLKLSCITLRAILSINIDESITITLGLYKLQKRIKPFCPSVRLFLHFFILFTHLLTSNNALFSSIYNFTSSPVQLHWRWAIKCHQVPDSSLCLNCLFDCY